MIKVLTAAGINPRRRGHNAPDYILKLHPLSALTPPALATLFRSSRLRGKCEALLVVGGRGRGGVRRPWCSVIFPFFFYCIAELAVKPCRSSSTNTISGPTPSIEGELKGTLKVILKVTLRSDPLRSPLKVPFKVFLKVPLRCP